MKSHLSVLAISALLLTGCSSTAPESKPEYDELDLMVYNLCLEKIVEGKMKIGTSFWLLVPTYTASAQVECAEFKPVKK
jgi:hypothetical protein